MEEIDKEFKFFMPLVKDYKPEVDDGFYHVSVAIASGKEDLQGDTMSKNALNQIVEQAKGMSVDGTKLGINIDDNHKTGLKSIIGPVKNAWLEDNQVIVDMAVSEEWKPTVKSLIDVGTALGGSIKGKALARNDKGEIDQVRIVKAALTDTPAAWDTRGTAKCTMCQQIAKSMDDFDLEKSWDGSASRFTDEQYKRSALWCDPAVAAGKMSAKSGCKLPVRDPDGKLNPAGVKAAYGALQGARNSPNMPASAKASAMSKLRGYYKQLGLTGIGPLKKSEDLEALDEAFAKLEKAIADNEDDIEQIMPDIQLVAKSLVDIINNILDEELGG